MPGLAASNIEEWKIQKLRSLREEMFAEDLVCPLLWITKGITEDICPNKLLDLMNFAPCEWDQILCALVIVTRGVLLSEQTYEKTKEALEECRAAMVWKPGSEPQCSLLLRYHAAMAHMIDASWVMATALHRGLAVRDILALLRTRNRIIPKVRCLSIEDQSAIAAARSLALQICHYTLWPSLMDERKPIFREAMDSATCAMALNPKEGVWHSLYARCLPWRHSSKAILLQAGHNLNATPFTTIEYASYLAFNGYTEALDEAARLCERAIRQWPNSVYVLANYVTLFLNSNCRAKLSATMAEVCLRGARLRAADSPLLAGLQWSLSDAQRAGGQLSPILEEGENVFDVGGWKPEKERALRAIAARLYPSAMQQMHHLRLPAAAPLPAQEQDEPAEPGAAASEALWSPKLRSKCAAVSRSPSSRAGQHPSSNPSPTPPPGHTPIPVFNPSSIPSNPTPTPPLGPTPIPPSNPPSNPASNPASNPPSIPSSNPPSIPSSSPTPTSAPSPSPVTSNVTRHTRMRAPLISGPLRRPRTPSLAEALSGVSSLSPDGSPASASAETAAPPTTASPSSSVAPSAGPSPLASPLASDTETKVTKSSPSPFPRQSLPRAAFARKSPSPVAQVLPRAAPEASVGSPPAVLADVTSAPEQKTSPPVPLMALNVLPPVEVPPCPPEPVAVKSESCAVPEQGASRPVPPALMSLKVDPPLEVPAGTRQPAVVKLEPCASELSTARPVASHSSQAQSRLDRIASAGPQLVKVEPSPEALEPVSKAPRLDLPGTGTTESNAPLATAEVKSSLRPNAPAWVPPARSSSSVRPKFPSTLKPVPIPAVSGSELSRLLQNGGDASDLILKVQLGLIPPPPVQYQCPAQGRLERIPKLSITDDQARPKPTAPSQSAPSRAQDRLERLKGSMLKLEVQEPEVQFRPGAGDDAKSDLECKGVKEEVAAAVVKLKDSNGFVTPPESEVAIFAAPCTLKQEPPTDFLSERKFGKSRVNLTPKFDAQIKHEAHDPPQSADLSSQKSKHAARDSQQPDVLKSQKSRSGLFSQAPVFARAAAAIGLLGPVRARPAKAKPENVCKHGMQLPAAQNGQSSGTATARAAPPPGEHKHVLICDDQSLATLVAECGDALDRLVSEPSAGSARPLRLTPGAPAAPAVAPAAAEWGASSTARTLFTTSKAQPSATAALQPRAVPASVTVASTDVRVPTARFAAPTTPSFTAPTPAAAPVAPVPVFRYRAPDSWPELRAPAPTTAGGDSSGSYYWPAASEPAPPASSSYAVAAAAPAPATRTVATPAPSKPSVTVKPAALGQASWPALSVVEVPAATPACAVPPTSSYAGVAAAPAPLVTPVAPIDAVPRPSRSVCPDALAEVRAVLLDGGHGMRPDSPSWHRSRSPFQRSVADRLKERSRSSSSSYKTASPQGSRASSPAGPRPKDHDVPLWRRGGGDSFAPAPRSSWRNPTSLSSSSCQSTALPDVVGKPDPSPVSGPPGDPSWASWPSADPSPPKCNCVCTSDCIVATFKNYGTLRPDPEVPKVCLKRVNTTKTVSAQPRRLSSRLPAEFLD